MSSSNLSINLQKQKKRLNYYKIFGTVPSSLEISTILNRKIESVGSSSIAWCWQFQWAHWCFDINWLRKRRLDKQDFQFQIQQQ